jgi:hypothetical protein
MSTDDNPTTGTAITAGATLAAHVRGYAEAVRLHLADLGTEVTDDLTGGLEADLTEALADAHRPAGATDDVVLDLAATFGPAAAYAAELRSAAGLPPEEHPRGTGLRGALAARGRRSRERWARRLEPVTSHPRWAALRELAEVLRPAWWLARGWLVGVVLMSLMAAVTGIFATREGFTLVPASVEQFLVMAGCALVSVQWARGRWLPERWLPRATGGATALAVLSLPFVLTATDDLTAQSFEPVASSYDAGYQDGVEQAHYASYGGVPGDDGVWVDGMQVSNLFAFDTNGDPIRDVQLYDDRGRPVRTITADGSQEAWEVPQIDGPWFFRPTVADDGHSRWNVYPLQALPENAMEWDDDGAGLEPVVGVRPEDMPWPFLKAPTTITREGAGEQPEGDPTPTPSPSESEGSDPTDPAPSEPAPSSTAPAEPTGGTPSDRRSPAEQVTVADGSAQR